MKRITAIELEKQIFDIEKVRVIFRCKKSKRFDAEGFGYTYKAKANTKIVDWINNRIRPLVGDEEVIVINGNGEIVNGRTLIGNIRNTYPLRIKLTNIDEN